MTARENLTTQNFVFIELLYIWYLSRVSKMAVEFEVPSCIRGYHVYHEVWSPDTG